MFRRFRARPVRGWFLSAILCAFAGVGGVLLARTESSDDKAWLEAARLTALNARHSLLSFVSDDEWMQSVRSGRFFRSNPQTPQQPTARDRNYEWRPFRPPRIEQPKVDPFMGFGDTYRTMCVRLCDGYAWPISFATSPGSFARDQKVCQQSCSSPTKLYTYRNPGGELDDMVSLDGQPYSALPSAYLYQAVYDENCKCRAHPWEPAALQRHRFYALEDRARKGDKQARAELRELGPQADGLRKKAGASARRRSRR